MILILDNNQYRRREIFNKLRLNGYIVSAQDLEMGLEFTKPFLTVLINPTNTELMSIKRENTKYLIIKPNKPDCLKEWMDYISLSSEIDIDIERYFWNNFKHENPKVISKFGCICVDQKGISAGGIRLNLKRTATKIAKFFIYNNQKKFKDSEVVSYFRFLSKEPEENLYYHVSCINGICKSNKRPPLISKIKGIYWLNNDYLRYTLEYCNDCYDDFTKVYKK